MQESTGISPVNPAGHHTGPFPPDGAVTGALVGALTGALVGFLTGALVGFLTGALVGAFTGALLGELTGDDVAPKVGDFTGALEDGAVTGAGKGALVWFGPPAQFNVGVASLLFTMSRRGVERSGMRSPLNSQIKNPWRPLLITYSVFSQIDLSSS